eukprot:4705910-Amphidinium_carterae.1
MSLQQLPMLVAAHVSIAFLLRPMNPNFTYALVTSTTANLAMDCARHHARTHRFNQYAHIRLVVEIKAYNDGQNTAE